MSQVEEEVIKQSGIILLMKPSDKDLTFKQRKWMDEYIQCGNATEAAMKVYDCKDRNSAKQIGYENLSKLDYREFLEEAGLTDKKLNQKIIEGLDATRTVSAKIITKGADSQTDDFIDVPDFMARHKYLETALKLKKRLDNKLDLPDNVDSMEITFKRVK